MGDIDLAILRVRFQAEDRKLQNAFDRAERRLNAFQAAGKNAGTVHLRAETDEFQRDMRGASDTVTRFKRQVARGISVGLKTTGGSQAKKEINSVLATKKKLTRNNASVRITTSGAKKTLDTLNDVAEAKKKASGKAEVEMSTDGAVKTQGAIKAVQSAANKLDRKKINIIIGGAATIASAVLTRQAIISVGERLDLLSNTARSLAAHTMPLLFGAAAGGTGVITGLGTSTLALAQALGSGAAGFALIGGAAGVAAAGGLYAYGGAAAAAVAGAVNVRDNLLSLQQAALSSDQAVTAAGKALEDAEPGTDAYAQAQNALALATEESAKAHEELRRVQILNTPAAQKFNAELDRSQTALAKVQAELGKRVLPSLTRMMQIGRQTAPELTAPLYDLAEGVSLVGEEFVSTALKGHRLEQIQNVLDLVSDAGVKGAFSLRNLGLAGLTAIQPVIRPARRLLDTMHQLSANAFDWTKSSEGAITMENVVRRLERRMYGLLRISGNVTSGFSGIFSAFNESGITDRTFNNLIRVSGGFARVGAEGSKSRQVIIDFARKSEPLMAAVMGVVREVGSEFGRLANATIGFRAEGEKNTVLVQIFDAIRDSVRPVTDMMLQMFEEVGPLIPDLIRNLGGLLNTFGGYTPVLATYLDTMSGLLDIFNGLPQPIKNNAANIVALSSIMKTTSGVSIPGMVGGFVALRTQMGALSLASGKNIGMLGSLKASLFGVAGTSTAAGTASAATAGKMTLLQRAGAIASKAMRGLGLAFRFMLGPWGLLIAGIAIGAVAIWKNWDKIKASGQSLVSWAMPAFESFKTTVVNAFQSVVEWAGPKLQQALGWAQQQGQQLVGWWNENLPLIKRTAQVVFGGLMNTVGLPLKAVFLLARAVFNAFVRDWNSGNSRVQNIIVATWRIVKNTIGTGIRIAGNLVKAGMQILTGDWSGAWQSVQRIGELAWNLLQNNVHQFTVILRNIFRGFGSWVSGWWNGLWLGVHSRWDSFSSNTFGTIKSWTANVREWISGFGSNVVGIFKDKFSYAVNTVRRILSFLAGAMGRVLRFVGANELASKAADVRSALEQPIMLAKGGVVIDGELQKMARGGLVLQPAIGGVTDRPRLVYGDAGEEAYVRTDKYTKESAKALQYANKRWAERGWNTRGTDTREPTQQPPRNKNSLFPASQTGGGAALGATMHTYIPALAKFAREARQKFGVYTNTYSNHPPGFAQPYYRERSVDLWGAYRGDPIGTDRGNRAADWAISRLGGALNWLIWNGRMLSAGGWGPDTSGYNHTGHIHITAFADAAKAMAGGGGGFNILRPAKALWDRLVPDMPDLGVGAFGGAIANWFKNTLLDRAWKLIKDNVSLGGGGGGGNEDNIRLGRQMAEAVGWTGPQWDSLKELWRRESNWDHQAENSSSGAYGIPQALPPEKMASAGRDWRTNPRTQIRWGLGYIRGRHGNPVSALAFHDRNNWYEQGGRIPGHRGEPKPIVAHAGEIVLPAGVSDAFIRFAVSLDEINRSQRLRALQSGRSEPRAHRGGSGEARPPTSARRVSSRNDVITGRASRDDECRLEEAIDRMGERLERKLERLDVAIVNAEDLVTMAREAAHAEQRGRRGEEVVYDHVSTLTENILQRKAGQ